MNKTIKIYTDASVKDGWGAGFGFVARYRVGTQYEEIKGSHYTKKQMKTTQAEFVACVYAIQRVQKELENEKEYHINMFSDCEKAVDRMNDLGSRDKYEKAVNHCIRLFNSITVFWIPRAENGEADNIARVALERGYREGNK